MSCRPLSSVVERPDSSENRYISQQMLSREQILTLMRDRVHHPAGMRELLQILKVPRDDRTTFKRHSSPWSAPAT